MGKGRFQKILVPTDFSEASLQTALMAIEQAQGSGATVHFFHAMDTRPLITYGDAEFGGGIELIPTIKSEAQKHLNKWEAKLPKGSAHSAKVTLAAAAVWDSICDEAKNSGSDLIIIGTQGMGALKRFVLGSVTEHVVRHAPCAVLVIPPATPMGK